MQYYTSEKIKENITAIRSLSGEIMYLIEGEEKAVLMDTCIGIKGLRTLVEELTEKPVTVLISHGHIDHAMGAAEFETVYMNHRDIPLYQSQCSIKERREYAGMGLGPEAEKLPDEAFVPEVPDFAFAELTDGAVFELGGISVQALEAYGHTQGCMAFLIPEERILILGDACNNATFLFDEICFSVQAYQQSMADLLKKTSGKYDRVLLMHHIVDAAPDILEQMIELCEEVMKGDVDHVPFQFMGKDALVAKRANERMEREDGKCANLIYHPDNIR